MTVTQFPTKKCCICGDRATRELDLIDADTGQQVKKLYCGPHFPEPLSEHGLALLVDERDREINVLKAMLTELGRAADTAELLLRSEHPAEASSLRGHVTRARSMCNST